MKLVLCAVGDPALKQGIERQLKALSFEVLLMTDAEGAIRTLETRKPHLVCIDLRLPRDSGYDLCEQIRTDRGLDQVQILVMGDRQSPEVIAYAEEAGANAYLARPFTIDLLARHVRSMLAIDPEARPGAVHRRLDEGLALE